jgi:hypothetical protein
LTPLVRRWTPAPMHLKNAIETQDAELEERVEMIANLE